jgi:hypothetical protein
MEAKPVLPAIETKALSGVKHPTFGISAAPFNPNTVRTQITNPSSIKPTTTSSTVSSSPLPKQN